VRAAARVADAQSSNSSSIHLSQGAEMSEIKQKIFSEIAELVENDKIEISDETPMLGDGSVLDSMKLVTLCIALEDIAADLDFDFDWTSEAAMSRSRSMFRTAGALADEFLKQQKDAK
jgi:acyl carrier protein